MKQFIREFKVSTDTSVLDVGGTPFNWALDSIYPVLTIANLDAANRPTVVCDGRYLPFKDGSFNIVYSNSVVEHVGGGNRGDQGVVGAQRHRAGAGELEGGHVELQRAGGADQDAVGGVEVVCSAGSQEVELVIADEVRPLPISVHSQPKPGVLDAKAGFGKFAGGHVVRPHGHELHMVVLIGDQLAERRDLADLRACRIELERAVQSLELARPTVLS